jgi:nanoRNase/pAp phosphatase (c-di-AMP/oligoRNAs hydrolase)
MLTNEQINELRREVEECYRPLIFFHDDADGLSSFLLFYRFIKEGKGIILKTSPELGENFIRKVDEYQPDKVFILDKPKVSQEFLDKVKCKVIWIDHHSPVDRYKVKYYNPRINDTKSNPPVAYINYKIVKQDLWIAMVGMIGDWFLPEKDLIKEFQERYPKLLPKKILNAGKVIYETRLGKLVKIFSFVLKGKSHDAMKAVKVLTRIKEPEEILEQSTAQGKFIYKKFANVNRQYQELLDEIINKTTKDRILLYIYKESKMSFTSDLSNELLYRFPNKIIIIGREKDSEIKFSIRSSNVLLPPIIEKALQGMEGYGGGHEYACGAVIKKKDLEDFMERFRKEII